jgi:hypothetical protein
MTAVTETCSHCGAVILNKGTELHDGICARCVRSKRRRPRYLLRILIIALFVLILAPLITGALQIGEREGPVIYPEALHTPLYIIGHDLAGLPGKPRTKVAGNLYRRPWFWGLPLRARSQEERADILRRADERNSPMLDLLNEENAKIEE